MQEVLSQAFKTGAGQETQELEVWKSVWRSACGRAGDAVGHLPGQAHRHPGELMAGVEAAPEERNGHCEKDAGWCTQTRERCLESKCDQEC